MKKTLLLIMIAAAIGAYVYFYEIKGGEERRKQKEAAEQIFHFDKDSVNRVEINSFKGNFIFNKIEDGWQIEQPVKTGADEAQVDSLLSNLSNAKKQRSFNVKKGDVSQYGLGKDALKITVSEKNGISRVLRLGGQTNIGSNVYASVSDTIVHLVEASLKNNADKSLFDWRDRKIIHLDKEKVREFKLKNPKGSFTFRRSGKGWNITKPLNTKADESAVDALLNKLDYGRIKSVPDENDRRKSKYSLYNPAYIIDLYSGAEKAKTSAAFSKLKDNSAYGKDEARPHIFEVDSSFIKPFQKDLFAFRDKSIINFYKAKVDRINLLYDSELLEFLKDSTSNWVLPTGERAKNWKIDNIISTLKNLKAERFVEENPKYFMPYGLINPEGRIEVFAGDDKIAELNIGYKKNGFVYIRNPRTAPLVTIKESKLNELFPAKEDLLEKVKTEREMTE